MVFREQVRAQRLPNAEGIQITLQGPFRNFQRLIREAELVVQILVNLIEGGVLEIAQHLDDEGVAEEGVAFGHGKFFNPKQPGSDIRKPYLGIYGPEL
jgi:hypothetical protein